MSARRPGPDPAAPFRECPPEIVVAMGGVVPTAQQWEAISQPLESYSIVAGAGSGKTSLMAARIAYLTLVRVGRLDAGHEGALPSEILGLTFTNKAAEHLSRKTRDAVAHLGLPESEEPTVMTYHAFGSAILQTYGVRLEMEPGAAILTEAQKWDLVGRVLEDREFEALQVRHPPYTTGQILDLADQCANLLVDSEDVKRADAEFVESLEGVDLDDDLEKALGRARQRDELADAVAEYRGLRRGLGRIDYGDQIELATRLAESYPEVGRDLRARFRVALLDEYQDTNLAQARLIRALFPPPFPLTAVGDPDQNIYAWRGASLTNLLEFTEAFGVPGRQLPLYVNFRSGSRILRVADRVAERIPVERRAPGKQLIPFHGRGTGFVRAFVARDQVDEADQIARMIREEHRSGRAWSDFAILCRKKRLFRVIDERLRAVDIPTEVVDVGGLLKTPEVVDLVAMLRVIADPARNVSLARLLLGPRWRIGYRDLARLAAWSAQHNVAFREEMAEADEDVSPGDTSFAMAESLEHLDEIEDLSDQARRRLAAFRHELGALRERAGGPPAELAFAIAERSGLLAEIESSAGEAAAGARQNVLSFLEHLESFAPLQGEPTLQAVLDHLDRAEQAEEEFEGTQPSEENTVKLMTIHKAKGLEWPVVFVPGLAEGDRWGSSIFPDVAREENPLTSASSVPFTLRPEFADFPDVHAGSKAWKAELWRRAFEAERRVCYVALTRARDVLVVSSAHWYEGSEGLVREPLHPGRFYREVTRVGDDQVDPEVEVLFEDVLSDEDALPENNPLVAARAARAASWPPATRVEGPDALFAQGWRRAAEAAAADASLPDRLASDLTPHERTAYEGAKAAALDRLAFLAERDPAREARPLPVPAGLSVSSLVTYDRCPKQFYWSVVRPLPRRPSPAATLGTAIHRWIEQESRGQGRLLDLDALPDLGSGDEVAADEGSLKDTWRRSRFAAMVPLATERPFELLVGGAVVRGRIDAVYGTPSGHWEVVDFKTGKRPPDAERSDLQLQLYALACQEIWRKDPAELRLTYYFIGSDEECDVAVPAAEAARAAVVAHLDGIRGRAFAPVPGLPCRSCDFRPFCPPGREWVARQEARQDG